MPEFDFDEWLERHEELVKEAQQLFLERKFKATIVKQGKTPSFVRIFFGKKKIDFLVKEVNTRLSKTIWLCKKSSFSSDKSFLLYTKRESFWLMTTGKKAEESGEYKESEWQSGVEYMVVPIEIFTPAKTFIKIMRKRLDDQIQSRIVDF